ncbi:uncharacterized protein KGF55_001013 [Candida pseudojiufengensis]|uniref:uncharacterized protein n=1 Tax=Candida pseudojiufengensis TaxID=497109 RepID=UPI0022244207|nr:uncharacterized protein KGF55_001013 [Candida pseudojiufengensis]KAI5965651.1 hypothetical protein KGF55_001013 [Candida pseudojiufengensis]
MSSSIVLQSLRSDLDPIHQSLLENDQNLRNLAEDYLQDLLINDELLSTDHFTTTNSPKKSIIEEIAELDSQKFQINQELSSITDSNKDLIIDVNNDINEIHGNLTNDYVNSIESLLKSLNIDHTHIQHVSNKYEKILSNMDSILDILELPVLCRLFILQGNYQESLEISTFIKSLIIRFPKIKIFKVINSSIEVELNKMFNGLIKLLNTNLKQSNLFKIFQILNKLETNSNNDQFLHSIFLNSRFKLINNEISSLKPILKFNKVTYLKRYLETYREYLYSSLSLYYSIFKNNIKVILVNQFVTSLIHQLCKEMELYFPKIEGDNDDNQNNDGLILQLIYINKSLASFQFEFEPLILLNLCYQNELFTEDDWVRNLSKTKRK